MVNAIRVVINCVKGTNRRFVMLIMKEKQPNSAIPEIFYDESGGIVRTAIENPVSLE